MQNTILCRIVILYYILFFSKIFALDGVAIIQNANNYKNHLWYCNDWNARTSNADSEYWQNNDLRYPFYPKGAIYRDQNLQIIESDGWHTGIAYGWGLRETREVFNEKLGKIKSDGSGYLAGWLGGDDDPLYKDEFWNYYTGLDCVGFVANCVGIPVIVRDKSYNIWHPGVDEMMDDNGYWTDRITWKELRKGDIVIKSIGKVRHVAIINDNGSTTRIARAIDASPNIKKSNNEIVSTDPRVKECTFTWVKEDTIYRSDGGTGYKPRRFNPPYAKRIAIYQEKYNADKMVSGYEKIYEKEWKEKADKTGREIKIPDNFTIKEARTGKLVFEVEFSKAMAVDTGRTYKGGWSSITMTVKSGDKQTIKIKAVDTDENYNYIKRYLNSNIDTKNGWNGGKESDKGDIYTCWLGTCEIKEIIGEVMLEISAKSLMQDELDSNPGTKAERTEKINYQLRINNFQLKYNN